MSAISKWAARHKALIPLGVGTVLEENDATQADLCRHMAPHDRGAAAHENDGHISAFLLRMKGEKYTRTISESATRLFPKRMLQDYGDDVLQRALIACKAHAVYYASLGYGRLAYVNQVIEEFKERKYGSSNPHKKLFVIPCIYGNALFRKLSQSTKKARDYGLFRLCIFFVNTLWWR